MARVTESTPPAELPYLMRVDDVAVWLGLSMSAVYRAIKRGEIKATRFGKALRVKRDDLVGVG